MALTRKYLSAMGIDEEKASEIINAHLETVNGLKDERDKLKADADKYRAVQKELDETKEKLKALGENGIEEKYTALQKEYDDYKKGVETDKANSAKTQAYRSLLKETGISDKRIDSVLKVTDLSKIDLDKEGNLKDKDKLTENIKSEWSEFIATVSQQGANTATPPANNGGNTMTKKEILAIKDATQRQKAIAEHLEMFGKGE